MIKRILKNLFFKKPKTLCSFEVYKNYIEINTSTFLKNSTIRFDATEKLEKRKYLKIGKKGIISSNYIFETEKGEIIIGDNVHIGGATMICRNKIEVKDDVTMAWGITLYDHNSHSIYWEERKNDNHQCYEDYLKYQGNNIVNKDWSNVISKPVIIESKVWIGFDVTILKGVTIGEGAVVGAKSVVTKDVEPWTVVAGNPAVVVKYLPEYKK
ncbi:hypothetical protein GCM10010992_10000 [Cloacibacterium rupense]|uniref:Acyltransferase n=1 Tax=Cloacibacterium rupense TaxID=517423 RepID=A0ABQ2NJV7_9FLAO|nr:acyltransferase [Cloacibacterium rupense]GGP03070.1 hypothetical protein GCM10010992_10000 [Cloacibacterium rupense]